jgi:CRP/FNR family transcriptional regulator, nitrogen oxide reductase regulator
MSPESLSEFSVPLLPGPHYLAFYREAHIALTYDTAHQRLAHALANLANTIGERTGRGIEVDVRNEELANEANVTPFTASRLVSAWQRRES